MNAKCKSVRFAVVTVWPAGRPALFGVFFASFSPGQNPDGVSSWRDCDAKAHGKRSYWQRGGGGNPLSGEQLAVGHAGLQRAFNMALE